MRTILLVVGGIIIIMAGAIGYQSSQLKDGGELGSVRSGSEYHATTTDGRTAGHYALKASRGSLSSITIASTSAGTLKVWDATSTASQSSSTIFTLPASLGTGTYTFDLLNFIGVSVELGANFNGNYIITYR